MKKILPFGFLLLFVVLSGLYFSCKEKTSPEKSIAKTVLTQVQQFSSASHELQAAAGENLPEKELQKRFLKTRLAYKRMEWAAEYFTPQTARLINGPPVPEVEMAGTQVLPPEGLQVIETLLFPKYDHTKQAELIERAKLLCKNSTQITSHFENIDILPWQVFDAAKLQTYRVLTLGITGFDNPLSKNALQEAAASLQGLKEALLFYPETICRNAVVKTVDKACAYLKNHPDFDAFDRAAFITRYGNLLSTNIDRFEKEQHIQMIRYNRLINQDAKTLFDTNAVNLNAYIPTNNSGITPEKTALGKRLFSDPILSSNGTRSCQSCHQPEKAFTDGLEKNTVFSSKKLLPRNTPTLINAALQPAQFYDSRVTMLENQALNVISNQQEMHGSLNEAVKKLSKIGTYRTAFAKSFPKNIRKNSIDTTEIVNALGSYVRSLTLLNSRFDEYMRGNKNAMNRTELNGFNLFMGKAKCGTCHYMPLFNGNFPPRFVKIESEVIGVPQNRDKKIIDGDLGRYTQVKIDAYKHAFKTTTVRNAALTAPYMHNGVFKSLDEVVDFYNKGGGVGEGYVVDNQTLPFDELNLSKKECAEIVAFIKSLDSRDFKDQ